MSTEPAIASHPTELRGAAVLAAIGAWTVLVPYLGEALGLGVSVKAAVEFADHVVPGAIVLAAGLYLHRAARRGALSGERFALPAAGLCFLAGFWVLLTHLPLIGDAADARVDWEAAIWHSVAAVPIVAVAAWCVVRAAPNP